MRKHDEYGPVMAHYFYAYDGDTISDIRLFVSVALFRGPLVNALPIS